LSSALAPTMATPLGARPRPRAARSAPAAPLAPHGPARRGATDPAPLSGVVPRLQRAALPPPRAAGSRGDPLLHVRQTRAAGGGARGHAPRPRPPSAARRGAAG